MASEAAEERTRQCLHAVSELVLAAPQYRTSGTIRLRVDGDGVRTVATPDLLLSGGSVTGPSGAVAVSGHTPRTLGDALGVQAGGLDDVFPDGSGVGLDDVLLIDEREAATVLAALAIGDAALRAFLPQVVPVLWPEHFDVAISVDEVNYGVSPGDGFLPVPYAYVGPWQVPPADDFWDAPFGAARPVGALGSAEAVQAFFEEGRARAGGGGGDGQGDGGSDTR